MRWLRQFVLLVGVLAMLPACISRYVAPWTPTLGPAVHHGQASGAEHAVVAVRLRAAVLATIPVVGSVNPIVAQRELQRLAAAVGADSLEAIEVIRNGDSGWCGWRRLLGYSWIEVRATAVRLPVAARVKP